MTSDNLSPHPTDRLIRDLIASGRTATAEEVAHIVERMATAPFDPRTLPAPEDLIGRHYLGRVVRQREPSAFLHIAKRVLIEDQWAYGVTVEQYEEDLRRAVRFDQAKLVLYRRRGGSLAAALAPTADVVPQPRRGGDPQALLLVIYSADRGTIISGYQISRMEDASITEEGIWLS